MSTVLIKGALRRYFAYTILALMSTTSLFAQAVLARDGPVNPGPPPPPGRIESCCLGVSAPASTQTSKSSGYVSQVGESSEAPKSASEKFSDALTDYFTKREIEKQKDAARARAQKEADERQQRETNERHQEVLDFIAKNYLYSRASTTGQADPNAMLLMGVYYEFGKKDNEKAKDWFLLAASRGVGAAMGELARMLWRKGQFTQEMDNWFNQGAEKDDFGSLMNRLAHEHQSEKTLPSSYDLTTVIHYRLKLDSLGYKDNFPRLYYMVGQDTFSLGHSQLSQDIINMQIVENQFMLGKDYYEMASRSTSIEKLALENAQHWLQQTIKSANDFRNLETYKEWRRYYDNYQKDAEKLSKKVQKKLEKL